MESVMVTCVLPLGPDSSPGTILPAFVLRPGRENVTTVHTCVESQFTQLGRPALAVPRHGCGRIFRQELHHHYHHVYCIQFVVFIIVSLIKFSVEYFQGKLK